MNPPSRGSSRSARCGSLASVSISDEIAHWLVRLDLVEEESVRDGRLSELHVGRLLDGTLIQEALSVSGMAEFEAPQPPRQCPMGLRFMPQVVLQRDRSAHALHSNWSALQASTHELHAD